MNRAGWLPWTITGFTLLCMVVPMIVIIGTSFNSGSEMAFPPVGFSLGWYANIFQREQFPRSFQFSLLLAVFSTLVSLTVGMLCAVALSRYRFFGKNAVAAAINSPLIVPQVVLGMGFLVLLAQIGIVSSLIGLGLLHLVLTLPYTVRVLVASLARFPPSLEEAAVIHGANRFVAFVRVTMPCIKPGIVSAAIFAFVTSFDNFTASQFLTWDRTTLPIEVYAYATLETDPTVCAISTLLIVMTTGIVVLAERWIGLETVTG